jgi:hypothetical protein
MDPKMDPSLLAASEASFVTLDLRLKSNSVPLELRPASVLALLDELMCMHVSFLDGYALANTLFSCLYLHRRSVLEHHTKFLVPSNSNVDSSQWHAAWRDACCAAVRAWVRVTAVARSLIQRADIFEEEDFSGNIPHLPPSTFVFADENPIEETSFANLCQEIDVDRVCSELSQAESTLELLLKQITPDQSATSASWIDALLSRLAFIKRYVASLSPLVTEVGSEQNWKAKDVREAARRLKKTIESADKIATSFSMPVEAADYTLSSIQSVPSAFLSNEKPTTTAKSMAAAAISAQSTLVAVPAPGFDPQVARAMTASTPPRYFRLYSRRDALAWLCGALNQLQRVCQIVDCMPTASPIAPRVDDAVMYARSLAAWSVVPSPIQQVQLFIIAQQTLSRFVSYQLGVFCSHKFKLTAMLHAISLVRLLRLFRGWFSLLLPRLQSRLSTVRRRCACWPGLYCSPFCTTSTNSRLYSLVIRSPTVFEPCCRRLVCHAQPPKR